MTSRRRGYAPRNSRASNSALSTAVCGKCGRQATPESPNWECLVCQRRNRGVAHPIRYVRCRPCYESHKATMHQERSE